MHSYPDTARTGGLSSLPRRAEGWLDQRGKWAWIATTVLAFIVFWPVGLALLVYMIWGKRMFRNSSCAHRHDRHARRWGPDVYRSTSGNSAFDSYKAEALRRLEEEQQAFEAFLQRLRNSKDKSEFDTFMEERARANQAADAAPESKPVEGPRPGEY